MCAIGHKHSSAAKSRREQQSRAADKKNNSAEGAVDKQVAGRHVKTPALGVGGSVDGRADPSFYERERANLGFRGG